MAVQAMGLVGAAIGFYFGGPMGAQAGYVAGTALGSAMFPPDAPPPVPIGQAAQMQSSLGKPVPEIAGTMRVGGLVLWAQHSKTVITEEAGGKGGGGPQSSREARVYSVAVAFCAGEADIVKIYADGSEVIYDASGTGAAVAKPGVNIRVYRGDWSQAPDPALVAAVGADRSPSYRGVCYVVISGWVTESYGNRLPQLQAVVTSAAVGSMPFDRLQDVDSGRVDWRRGWGFYALAEGNIAKFDIWSMTGRGSGAALIHPSRFSICADGYLYGNAGSGNSEPVLKIDPTSLSEVGRWGNSSTNLGNTTVSAVAGMAWTTTKIGSINYLVHVGGIFSSQGVGVLNADAMQYVWHSPSGTGSPARGLCPGDPGVIWIGCANSLISITIERGASYDPILTDEFGVTETAYTILPGDIGATTLSDYRIVCYDPADGGVVMAMSSDLYASGRVLLKWRAGLGVMWHIDPPIPFNLRVIASNCRVSQGMIGWVQAHDACEIDLASGAVVGVYTVDSPADITGDQCYDSVSRSVVGGGVHVYLGRLDGAGVALSDVVSRICSPVLSSSQIDVSALTGLTVQGYAWNRGRPAAHLTPLIQAYLITTFTSGGKIVFGQRGGEPVATIDYLEFIDGGEDILSVERVQDPELPRSVTVRFLDPIRDYQQGSEVFALPTQPIKTTGSLQDITVDVPLAMPVTQARRLANVLTIAPYNERVIRTGRLGWKYLTLDPGDTVEVMLPGGSSARCIVSDASVSTDLTVSIVLTEEEPTALTSDITAEDPDYTPGPGITLSETRLVMIDCPLPRDLDDIGPYPQVLVGMAGFGGNWSGGALYESINDEVYSYVRPTRDEAAWGIAVNALPQPVSPWVTDTASDLTVFWAVGAGRTASVSDDVMQMGSANPLAIITAAGAVELINAKTVMVNADGSVTYSNLYRGRRGTEWVCGLHGPGETVVLLDAAIFKHIRAASDIGATRYYRGVGAGMALADSDTVEMTVSGRSLLPYAPARVTATASGADAEIAWLRRTRVGWRPGFTPPLSEESELYSIDIILDGVVARTLSSALPAVIYTQAQMAEDGHETGVTVPLSIINPGAEAGAVTGWTGAGGLDVTTSSTRSGAYAFRRASGGTATGYQDIPVPAGFVSTVDAGRAAIDVVWWQYTYQTIGSAGMAVDFYDGDGLVIESRSPDLTINEPQSTWQNRTVRQRIPPLTRTLRIHMTLEHEYGAGVETRLDDITATLVELGRPGALTVDVYQVSATVGRGFTNRQTIEVT